MASCPPCLYKKRVGNFYVCFSSVDKKQDGAERIYCLVPMCWPMLIFTFSLMSLVTVPMLYFTVYKVHPLWACVELLTTCTLYSALALTSFRDFGVFPRYHRKPQPNQVPDSVSTVDPVRAEVGFLDVSQLVPCCECIADAGACLLLLCLFFSSSFSFFVCFSVSVANLPHDRELSSARSCFLQHVRSVRTLASVPIAIAS